MIIGLHQIREVKLMKFSLKFRAATETLRECFALLDTKDKFKVKVVIAIQILLGLLDLIGVALIGVLGSLAVRGVSSKGPGNRVSQVLDTLHLSNLNFQNQIAILALISTAMLISRTLLSMFISKRVLVFLAAKSSIISGQLISKYVFQTLTQVRSKSIQESLYITTRGVDAVTLGIIGNIINLISDFAILVFLICGLVVVDYKIAFGVVVIFGFVSYLLFNFLHKRAKLLGELENSLSIKSNERIVEAIQAYRELTVSNRMGYASGVIRKSRSDLASVLGEIAFLPSISKYAIEITVILGTLVVSAMQFLSQDASRAVAILSIFMAAATRIAPATMRLQQGLISIKQSHATALPTLILMRKLKNAPTNNGSEVEGNFLHEGFSGDISFKDISLVYEGKKEPALDGVFLEIPDAISKWPGAIAYVPQDVFISNESVLHNVALGFPKSSISEARVWNALRAAQLDEVVREFSEQVHTKLGEGGGRLSGGQRQRLGIARALYTNPKLIVLDEATSSLDGKTEQEISNAFSSLRGQITLIVIAHRLSTVRQADKVIYLSNGRIGAIGTFDEVRAQIKDFDEQAQLMGL